MIIKSELYKIFKSKKSIIFLVLIMLMPIYDLFLCYKQNLLIIPSSYSNEFILNPNMATFLAGTTKGHISQMLLVWIMPLYLLNIYSDSYLREKKIGYIPIVFSKTDRKKVVYSKFIVSFMVPFLASLISLSLNFLLAHLIFNGGRSFRGLEVLLQDNSLQAFLRFSLTHPTLVSYIFIIIYSFIVGGCGVICTGLSFLLGDYKSLYSISFILWIVQIAYKYSLTYAMQPFTEYGLDYIITAVIIYFIIMISIVIISFIRKVRLDEA